ncbi:DUF1819 family protein [Aureimonas sp. AU20]|uniref:DUF1819 family protein n=1 Tax=Aureimonas sp. AU20 TaxID=1349819 RepID=UPI0007214565|nr:DUF1819 family protein [Aureimonas sp. AU20]ALN72274.1 hypothetical protein M673_06075 [Aureimonas sp. AU20]
MSKAKDNSYLMSFGTGGLYVNESVAVARLHRRGADWDVTAAFAREAGAFQVRKASSAQRSIREIVNRLRWLSDEELEVLVEGERSERAALLWLAACRAYRFIGEFAVEVLNERFLSLRPDLTYDDFDTLLASKAEWSPKLASLSSTTQAKLRAVLFRLMREAEIVSPDDRILGSILSRRVLALIHAGNPDELRFFPGAERQMGEDQ